MLAAMLFTRVTSLVAIAILQTYWFLQPLPVPLKILAALLVIVGIARPAYGVLALAAVAPVSTVIANLCNAPGLGAQGATAADLKLVFADAHGALLPTTSRQVLGAGPTVAGLRDAAQRTVDEVRAALG